MEKEGGGSRSKGKRNVKSEPKEKPSKQQQEAAKKNVSVYSLYRKSTLGICLTDAVDEFVEKRHITPELAQKMLEQFDKAR